MNADEGRNQRPNNMKAAILFSVSFDDASYIRI